jgi:hypothetical protein
MIGILQAEYEAAKEYLSKLENDYPEETDEDVLFLREHMKNPKPPLEISIKISNAVSRVYANGPVGALQIQIIMDKKRKRVILENKIRSLKQRLIGKWYEDWMFRVALENQISDPLLNLEINTIAEINAIDDQELLEKAKAKLETIRNSYASYDSSTSSPALFQFCPYLFDPAPRTVLEFIEMCNKGTTPI